MPHSRLRVEDGFVGSGDDFYAALLDAHEGLSDEQSAALNARLVLLLANHIGDLSIIREALMRSRATMSKNQEPQ